MRKLLVVFLIILMAGCLPKRQMMTPDEAMVAAEQTQDSKVSALTELTAIDGSDLLYVIDDPAGTPVSKKITATNLFAPHIAEADPHAGYMLESNIGFGANNYLQLGATPGTPDGTKYLKDNGTWDTPSGGAGTVDTSGTPVLYDIARFTDADTIEGRSYAELKGDLGLEIGTDVQAYDADLTTYAGVTPTATGLTFTQLTDQDADRIAFWDDSAGAAGYLVPNTGLEIVGTNLNVAITSADIGLTEDSILVGNDSNLAAAVASDSLTMDVVTTGILGGKINTVINSDTAAYNVTAAQASTGTFFLTTNAATTTYTLPAATAGYAVCAKMGQGNAQILRLDTDGTDYIVMSTGARTSAAGDYYGATSSATNQVCAVCFDATDWYVTSETGTWTEE